MKELRVTIPEGVEFADLRLTLDAANGRVRFRMAPIAAICEASNLDLAELVDGAQPLVVPLIRPGTGRISTKAARRTRCRRTSWKKTAWKWSAVAASHTLQGMPEPGLPARVFRREQAGCHARLLAGCDGAATRTLAWTDRLAKCRAMFSTLDQQPPELLHAVYARLSRRYGAPGVRLADFAGRWQVFRTTDLAVGLERAVIDAEPTLHDTAEGLAEMESRAEFAVGDGHDATLVLIHTTDQGQPDRPVQSAPATPVLTITVWSLAHPVLVTGHIELDGDGIPMRIHAPRAVGRRMH